MQNALTPVIAGVGKALTVKLNAVELVHPLASVTVTLYGPATVALIVGVVAPVDQEYAE